MKDDRADDINVPHLHYNEVFLAVDGDGQEHMFSKMPYVYSLECKLWRATKTSDWIYLPDGSIQRLIGKSISFEDGVAVYTPYGVFKPYTLNHIDWIEQEYDRLSAMASEIGADQEPDFDFDKFCYKKYEDYLKLQVI